MNKAELADFMKSVSRMKWRGRIYQKPVLPRKVILSSHYQDSNTQQVNGKGTKCMSYHHVLKHYSQITTTRGCIIYQFPLYSSISYQFKYLKDSCEWRWYSIANLSMLPQPNKFPEGLIFHL